MNNELSTNCKFILDQHIPIDELLGSVTTYNNVEGSDSKNMQIRASARVFKKMKLDSTPVPAVPSPVVEKKESTKEEAKPEAKKPFRPLWEHEDKNLFFEALNEYGKDFEAIHSYICNKLKKKGIPELQIKSREQVRHLYYRTWHKISKYLKFSDEIKKATQELYGLINYGEMRKRLAFVSEKSCTKLNELIYRGFVAIRIKGKTIRIRTPMCRALRSLNKLDERHSDLKLPLKITVELKPKNMETWLRVQQLSQNPLAKITMPLQKRLSSILMCMSDRWRTPEMIQYEETLKQMQQLDEENEDLKPLPSLLRFSPPEHCNLDFPILNLTEYLTSQNICLTAYEERLGVKVRGEQLWLTSLSSSCKATMKKNSLKRMRHESSGEKLSPPSQAKNLVVVVEKLDLDTTTENAPHNMDPQSSVNEVVDDAVNTILALQNHDDVEKMEKIEPANVKIETDENKPVATPSSKYENEMLQHINGWTVENAGTLCIGDLYLMYGSDAKLSLEYSWDKREIKDEEKPEVESTETSEKPAEPCKERTENSLSSTLKRLLSVAKLHYRKNKIECPCGHICGSTKSSNPRSRNVAKNIQAPVSRDKFYTNTDKPTSIDPGQEVPVVQPEQTTIRRLSPSILFRRPSSPNDLLRAQLDSIQRLRPRYCNRRGRRPRTKPVVVERKLPILANRVENGRQIVQMSIISQDNISSGPRPIAPKLNVESSASAVEIVDGGFVTQRCLDGNFIDVQNAPTFSIVEIGSMECQVTSANNGAVLMSDNATTPSRVGSPTGITNLIEMAMTANINNGNHDGGDPLEEAAITSFVGLLPQGLSSCTPPSSPSRVLKETENQWLNSEVADFSLSSFLGHLESPMKGSQSSASCAAEDTRMCLTQEVQSLLTESSLDYAAKFADLAAQVTDMKK